MGTQGLSLPLYVHIPFCRFKCFYCDFNTYAGIENLIPAYVDALTNEIRRWGEALRENGIEAETPTVFFGGGTPSLLEPSQVKAIIEAISGSFTLHDDAEISMEVNPESVTQEFVREVVAAGVNRFSMGAQSVDDSELRMLGRLHDAAGIGHAIEALRAGGATNVNLDLMYGLPHQTLQTWESSLKGALGLTPEHLSLYALTVEEATPFHGWVESGRLPLPDPDLAADMYEMAEERMRDAGYDQYEISNWARPGRECRHNLAYWLNSQFLGFGPGAHSHLFGTRFSVMRQPRGYIQHMSELSGKTSLGAPTLPPPNGYIDSADSLRAIAPIDTVDPYAESMRRAETFILGLRLNRGVSEEGYRQRFGVLPTEIFSDAIETCVTDDLLERDHDVLRLTARGRLLSNEAFVRIMANSTAPAYTA